MLLSVIHIPQTKRMVELLAWTDLRQGNLEPAKTAAGH